MVCTPGGTFSDWTKMVLRVLMPFDFGVDQAGSHPFSSEFFAEEWKRKF
jgi:hypothetical protein